MGAIPQSIPGILKDTDAPFWVVMSYERKELKTQLK